MNGNHTISIKDFTLDELRSAFDSRGIEKYRANQIMHALYVSRLKDFDDIKILPKPVRTLSASLFHISSFLNYKIRKSQDGSIKILFKLKDGLSVETVYMPWIADSDDSIERVTLCVSTQAGCPVGCAFCATASLGLQRNLYPSEIIEQLLITEEILNTKITNVVFMGMGEPLLNYINVLKAINILTEKKNRLLSRKRITLSTAGVVPRIYELADSQNPVKLAISLHATTNGLRSKLMPISKSHSISKILDAVEYYYRKTKMKITYEYILFEGLNDSIEDSTRLSKIALRVPSRVNIIPFNDISFTHPRGLSAELKPASDFKLNQFAEWLRDSGVPAIVRNTFGSDIEAACGQLALADDRDVVC